MRRLPPGRPGERDATRGSPPSRARAGPRLSRPRLPAASLARPLTTSGVPMSSRSGSPGLRWTARLLGVASLGLGIAQLRSPTGVARLAGVDDSPTAQPVITAVGVRELVHAAGLLTGRP